MTVAEQPKAGFRLPKVTRESVAHAAGITLAMLEKYMYGVYVPPPDVQRRLVLALYQAAQELETAAADLAQRTVTDSRRTAMTPEDLKVEELSSWLRTRMPEAQHVHGAPIGSGESIQVRLRSADGKTLGTIIFSEEALDDHSAEDIVADLTRHRVIDLFRANRRLQLRYSTDRQISVEAQ